MIDNITAVKEFKPPAALNKAKGKPFEYNGIIYSPKYLNGQVQRYEGTLKNLRLFMYPEKIYLSNSLHKFFHGCNYNDFYSNQLTPSIEAISNSTGINWKDANIKKIEYGCNVSTNVNSVINSLQSYKGKDFQPMINKGIKYGTSCGFDQYRAKGYDKGFQVRKLDKINLKQPLFRWEIQVNNAKYFTRFKQSSPLKMDHLFNQQFLMLLAIDALNIYNNTLKVQKLQLSKLTAHEKRVIATMLNSEIRDDLKQHNKETYKRDRRTYKRIVNDSSICLNDETGELLEQKFRQLIEGEKPTKKQIIKIITSSL